MAISRRELKRYKEVAATWGYPPTLAGVIEYLRDLLIAKGLYVINEDPRGESEQE